MSLGDLLLGTSRLRREIAVQSLQLGKDIHHAKLTGKNLRRIVFARMTSPLALASATGLGFILGKWHRQPSHINSTATPTRTRQTLSAVAGTTLSLIRSMSWQWLIPVAIEWMGSKAHRNTADAQNASNQ